MVTGQPLNKRGVRLDQYSRADEGPTAHEIEWGDKYCDGTVQPVDRIFNPGLHSQDLKEDEKIAVLYGFSTFSRLK